MLFPAKNDNGQLIIFDQIGLKQYLNKYAENTHFEVDIEELGNKITDRQRRYYRGGIISHACKYLPLEPNDLHKYMKHLFLMELEEICGEIIPVTKSTSSGGGMNTKEMAQYTEKVRIYLRDPDNIWHLIIDTLDPDEYFQFKAEGLI